jgi:hypothetical protein
VWISTSNKLSYKSNGNFYTPASISLANSFSSTQIIDVTSASTALRVTQKGTGEALRVEDDTTPDATAFVVSNAGKVGIGVTPDAAVALSVDTSGVKFGDGTIQTTAATGTPSGTAGGDLAGTYPNPTVDGLQGNPVSNTAPSSGQVLQWNGTAWSPGAIPPGGSGGGGLVYFLNYQNTTNISPTTGLPTSPVAPSQLGRNYSVGSGSITSANLTQGSYSLICGFVTEASEPNVTEIPAGLWDFNIWADVSSASGNLTQFQIRVFKYNSTTGVYTSLANSDDIYIYDPSVIAQYIGNVTMPQTTILATDRIYVELWAQKNVTGTRTVSFYFDSLHPSHCHTTLPSVSGSGVVKVVNGVFQSPASTIVDVDVSASAAIAQSKIANLTSDLLGKAGTSNIQTFTSSANWIKPTGAKSVNIQLFGAGAGGSSGSRGAAGIRIAGGGGGGGGYFSTTIEASLLSPSESVTIGAGGTGGAARTVDNTGQTGATGGDTIFNIFRATGGRGPSTYDAAGISGSVMGGSGASASAFGFAGSSATPTGLSSSVSTFSRGGGSGGGLTAVSIESNGGAGGFATNINQFGGTGGVAGGAVNGGNGYSVATGFFAAGSGGGGGASSITANAGTGGTGGFPAGGGGGGGASQGFNSGAGGAGANGTAVITTYF